MARLEARSRPLLPTWTQLVDYIDAADKRGPQDDGRKHWTTHIKQYLGSKAKIHGAVAYPDRNHVDRGEYLVDLVWSYESKRTPWFRHYQGLMLALECEWTATRDAFWEDFIKLADVQADRRVHVGHLKPKEGAGELRNDNSTLVRDISAYLKGHKHISETDGVLVVLWNQKDPEARSDARLFMGDGSSQRLR